MASGYNPFEIEITIVSAKDLKNVNWRHGDLKPYAVVWVDRNAKCSTRIAEEGDTDPVWNEKLKIPLKDLPEESTLYIHIVHAGSKGDPRLLIGSASIPLSKIIDEAGGLGKRCFFTLMLKLRSGRPQGKLEVKIAVHQCRYQPPQRYAPSYGQQSGTSRGTGMEGTVRRFRCIPVTRTGHQRAYRARPVAYGAPAAAYGSRPCCADPYYRGGAVAAEKGSSKYGMGTGLAVGAVAAVLGGRALAEDDEYVADWIADDDQQSGTSRGTGMEGTVRRFRRIPVTRAGHQRAYRARPVAYRAPAAAYGSRPCCADPYYRGGAVAAEKGSSKYGMGTGLAVGAVAAVLGGLALEEDDEYVADWISGDDSEGVEDDFGYDGDDY